MTLQPRPLEPPDDDNTSASLGELIDGTGNSDPGRRGRHRRPPRALRRPRSTWPRWAEKILGGWAPTLRMAALLLVVMAAGLAGVVAVWGAVGGVFVVLLCALLHRIVSRLDRRPAI